MSQPRTRRVDATAPTSRFDVRDAAWWLAELTLAGEEPTVDQVRTRFNCSRATAFRWLAWLRNKKIRLGLNRGADA